MSQNVPLFLGEIAEMAHDEREDGWWYRDRVIESDVAALISGWGREITPQAG